LVVTGAAGEQLGASVSGIGDVGGDPLPDIALGAPAASRANGRRLAGAVYVVYGRSDTALPVTLPAGPDVALPITGADSGDRFGTTLAAGDPWRLLVGAPYADPLGRRSAGAVYALLRTAVAPGALGIDAAFLDRGGVRLAGRDAYSFSGRAITGAPGIVVGGTWRTATEHVAEPKAVATPVAAPDVPAPPPPGATTSVAGCQTIGTVEVVLDGSQTLQKSDPQQLRREAVMLLLTRPSSARTVLGAITIGSRPTQVFLPLAVAGDAFNAELGTLRGLLEERTVLATGATDYLYGLEVGRLQNPQPGAEILVTDAVHGMNPDFQPPAGTPRIYVIELMHDGARPGEAPLRKLARATGGDLLPVNDLAELPTTLDQIVAALECEVGLPTTADTTGETQTQTPHPGDIPPPLALTPNTPARTFTTRLPEQTRIVAMTASWDQRTTSPLLDSIAIKAGKRRTMTISSRTLAHVLGERGRPVRVGPLSVRARAGSTFITLRIAGLNRVPARGAGAARLSKPSAHWRFNNGGRHGRTRVTVHVTTPKRGRGR
jgi:hypothetical protein